MFLKQYSLCLCVALGVVTFAAAEEDLASTRPEMKKQIEALKGRTSRLPLPAPTAEDLASGRPLVNNGRLRSIYLPPSWQSFVISGWGGGSSRTPVTSTTSLLKTLESTPGYGFKTRLFWVVSRANDCRYCLGHQELKLKRIGMTDDESAALDCRWDRFPAKEQAAIKATRKLTLTPQLFDENDISELKRQFSDAEIIDIIYTVSRYNAVNRWTASTGIPQDKSFGGEDHGTLETPTSAEFANVASIVIPLDVKPRPEWESKDRVENELKSARARKPAVELPSIADARKILAKDSPGVIPPTWFQALANLPVALDTWAQRQALVRDGKTPQDLRILIAWTSARENSAWYSMGHARARYLSLGGDENLLYSFADLEKSTTPGNAEALRFARKLTSAPHTIVDADIARLQETFSNFEVAEIIQLTCDANAFDRFTEALRLPLEIN